MAVDEKTRIKLLVIVSVGVFLICLPFVLDLRISVAGPTSVVVYVFLALLACGLLVWFLSPKDD